MRLQVVRGARLCGARLSLGTRSARRGQLAANMVRAGATQELVVVLSRPLGLVLAEQPGGTGAVLVESLAPGTYTSSSES
jgi:hypothetical protein